MVLLWRRAVPSWQLVMSVVALLMAYRPSRLLGDPDTYMHIAAGNWMLAHRALPAQDPFSWSAAGMHWVAHEWLAEVLMAELYGHGGWAGLAVATALCFALSIGLLTRAILNRMAPLIGLVLAFLALDLLKPHLLARPHVLALPAMVLWCSGLFAARDAGGRPSWWLLPVLVLWVNLHGSFMAGVALAGYLTLEAVLDPAPGQTRITEARRWGSFTLAAIASTFLNANGIDGVLEPFRITGMPTLQSTFLEWRPPEFQNGDPAEIWLLAAIFLGFSTGARLPMPRLLLLVGLFHLVLRHQRHEDLLAVIGSLAIVAPLAPKLNALAGTDSDSPVSRLFAVPPARAATPAIILTLGVVSLLAAAALRHPIARDNGSVTPSAALEAARQAGVSGRVFNSEHFGGYLIFSGVPVFIDGRMELYGDEFLKRYLGLAAGSDGAALTAALDRDRVDWTILDPNDRAVIVLDHQPGWKRLHGDAYAVVHVRSNPLAR